jgi:hypothetical protein
MARLEVLPFVDEHLDEAAALLAARHARQRETELLLPSRYEAPDTAHEEVAALWHTSSCPDDPRSTASTARFPSP